jgi:hypothetical protein
LPPFIPLASVKPPEPARANAAAEQPRNPLAMPNPSTGAPRPTTGIPANVALAEVPLGSDASPVEMQLAADLHTKRGDEMLAANDIAAARTYYGYAAIEGSARAAVALVRTYDANYPVKPAEVTPAPKPVAQIVHHRRRPRVRSDEMEDSETTEEAPQGPVARSIPWQPEPPGR